jgi:hypothetical protein
VQSELRPVYRSVRPSDEGDPPVGRLMKKDPHAWADAADDRTPVPFGPSGLTLGANDLDELRRRREARDARR